MLWPARSRKLKTLLIVASENTINQVVPGFFISERKIVRACADLGTQDANLLRVKHPLGVWAQCCKRRNRDRFRICAFEPRNKTSQAAFSKNDRLQEINQRTLAAAGERAPLRQV